jgi:hypothetical protein
MDEDRNLHNGVGLEVDRLQPVVAEKPAEESPREKAESLLVEGPEDNRLGLVLRGELLAVVALPSGDHLLREEAAHLHVLQLHFGESAGLPRPIGRWGHVSLDGGRR